MTFVQFQGLLIAGLWAGLILVFCGTIGRLR